MKHCEAMNLEVTPAGAIFKDSKWPAEIKVSRGLLDYLPGPHVMFGRMGILRFTALNGYAIYRREADIAGGWRYILTPEHILKAETPEGQKPEPRAKSAEREFIHHHSGDRVRAFQWEPHRIPPVELPSWFLNSDFEHKAEKGHLLLRGKNPVTVTPGDWIINHGGSVYMRTPDVFAINFKEV